VSWFVCLFDCVSQEGSRHCLGLFVCLFVCLRKAVDIVSCFFFLAC